MALIKCPECGKEISDTTAKCIHCGYKRKRLKFGKNSVPIIVVGILVIVAIGIVFMKNRKSGLDIFEQFQDTMTSEDFSKLFGKPIDRTEVEYSKSAIKETYNYSIEGLDGKISARFRNGVYDGRICWEYSLSDQEDFSDYSEQIEAIYNYFVKAHGEPVYESQVWYIWETNNKKEIAFMHNYAYKDEKLIGIEYRNHVTGFAK